MRATGSTPTPQIPTKTWPGVTFKTLFTPKKQHFDRDQEKAEVGQLKRSYKIQFIKVLKTVKWDLN